MQLRDMDLFNGPHIARRFTPAGFSSLPFHARRALKLMTVAALAIILWKPKLFQRPECVVIMIRALLFAVIVFLSAMTAAAQRRRFELSRLAPATRKAGMWANRAPIRPSYKPC
jgi:hypothetical protein